MRRFFVLLFFGVAAALGIWYGLRGSHSFGGSSTAVTSLLPKETLALAHLPDFKRSRGDWHETDLYKLWREPAVQDFLQRPLSRLPQTDSARQKLQDMDALEMKDAFVAVTAFENHEPKLLAGFRFKGSEADAEKVIGSWRVRLQEQASGAKSESVSYQGHTIEVVSKEAMTVATAYDGQWFFAGNDLASLKTLLDRADKRVTDLTTTLAANEEFSAALKRMPSNYALFAYARLDTYMKQLAERFPSDANGSEQASQLRSIRSVSGATAFTNGKVHDVVFVSMPKMEANGALTRSSLSLATKNSFLYAAKLLTFPKQFTVPDAQAAGATGPGAGLQRFLATFGAAGITREDWEAAFGSEIGMIGDWPTNSRLPALLLTLGVKDSAKARKVVEALSSAAPEGSSWTASERNGVLFYSQPAMNPMMPVAPTVAISPKLLVAGLDATSVEDAINRGASAGSSSELAAADAYKAAEHLVPAPEQSFTYVDTPLLYGRLDTAVRPMLIMAAAFMPAIAETVDLGKLPPAEVITRHLSPLVLSQRYEGNGYVVESVGPLSVYQAVLGVLGATGAGASFYQSHMQGSLTPSATALPALPDLSPSPTPEATP